MACGDQDSATGLRQASGTFDQGYDLRLLVPCLRSTAQIDKLAGEPCTPAMLLAAADEIERLREALRHAAAVLDEAAVDLGDWGAYADEYTRKKHALCDDVKYYERAASAARGMVTPNAELRGASQLAGAASRSNAGLGEEG